MPTPKRKKTVVEKMHAKFGNPDELLRKASAKPRPLKLSLKTAATAVIFTKKLTGKADFEHRQSRAELAVAVKEGLGSAAVTHSSQMTQAQLWLNREQYVALRKKEAEEAKAEIVRTNWALVNRCSANSEKFLLAAARGKGYAQNFLQHEWRVDGEDRGGVDVNTKSFAGNLALHKAAENGHEDIVEQLIKNGANLDAVNQFGKTALHKACFYKQIGIIRILLEAGADPDIVDTVDGWTALHRASRFGHDFVARLLLVYGADPDKLTNRVSKRTERGLVDQDERFTAMDLAIQGRHKCVQDLLRNKRIHGQETREWFGDDPYGQRFYT